MEVVLRYSQINSCACKDFEKTFSARKFSPYLVCQSRCDHSQQLEVTSIVPIGPSPLPDQKTPIQSRFRVFTEWLFASDPS